MCVFAVAKIDDRMLSRFVAAASRATHAILALASLACAAHAVSLAIALSRVCALAYWGLGSKWKCNMLHLV